MLSENVTLNDLVLGGQLSNPARYLRMALGNMLRVAEFGKVTLRIGLTGKGSEPSYLLEGGSDGTLWCRFDGSTHQPWIGSFAHHQESWSKTTMDGTALHQLWFQVTTGK